MALFFASTIQTSAPTSSAASTTFVNTPNAIDDDFSTFATLTGSQSDSQRGIVQWIYTASGWTGVPNDSTPLLIKANVRIRSSGTSADRSGFVLLTSVGPPTAIFDQIVWDTSTGNIDVTRPLVLSRHTDATPILASEFFSGTRTVEVFARLSARTQPGTSVLLLNVFEIYLETALTEGDLIAVIL